MFVFDYKIQHSLVPLGDETFLIWWRILFLHRTNRIGPWITGRKFICHPYVRGTESYSIVLYYLLTAWRSYLTCSGCQSKRIHLCNFSEGSAPNFEQKTPQVWNPCAPADLFSLPVFFQQISLWLELNPATVASRRCVNLSRDFQSNPVGVQKSGPASNLLFLLLSQFVLPPRGLLLSEAPPGRKRKQLDGSPP